MTTSIYTFDAIKSFIVDTTSCDESEVSETCDLFNDLGCYGDDFHELIESYSQKFKVKMDNYLWYFHTEEEGHSNSFGRLFFKAPYERVEHIAVTPALLLGFANQGEWLLKYPEHSLPKKRYDILVNQILLVLFILFVVYKCAR